MAIGWVCALVAVALVLLVVSEWMAKRRAAALAERIDDWDELSDRSKAAAAHRTLVKVIEDVVALRRALVLFCAVVLAAGTWSLVKTQDTSNTATGLVTSTCQYVTDLLRLQSSDLTNQIRQRQVRRDATADEIIALQAAAAERGDQPGITDVPEFAALPAAVQEYASALAAAGVVQQATVDAANLSDANRRLTVYDEDLKRLREQVDDLRSLTTRISATCPAVS